MKQKKSFLCRHNRCLNTAKAICVSFLFSIPAGTAVAAVHAAEVDIVQQNETVKGTVLDETIGIQSGIHRLDRTGCTYSGTWCGSWYIYDAGCTE